MQLTAPKAGIAWHTGTLRILFTVWPTKIPKQFRPSTPLMEAILMEDRQEAYRWTKYLLESGEDPNKIDDVNQRSPLFAAWWEQDDAIIKLLLEFGASADIDVGSFDEVLIAYCPISTSMLICNAGFRFDAIISKNQLNELVGKNYSNPLEYFLEKELWDHISAFEPYGILKLIHVYDGLLGLQPLACMARDGLITQARWLLDHGADVNAHCEGLIGSTALEEAVSNKHLDITRLLLMAGANPNIPKSMWISVTDRVVEYGPHRTKLKHDSRNENDLVEIKELVLEASKRFPPPTYPNGTSPEVWPPKPKRK